MFKKLFISFAIIFCVAACKDNHSCNYEEKSNTLACPEKTYKTINVQNKIWLAENLNFYEPDSSFCYESDHNNCTEYGRLYDFNTAKIACPVGWRLPTKQEFVELFSNKKVNEISEFDLKLAGFRYYDGNFADKNKSASFWSADEYDVSRATLVRIQEEISYEHFNKNIAASVRCVKD